MRILLVNHLLDPVSGGGTAERVFQITRFLALAGETCTVLTLDIGLEPRRVVGLGSAQVRALPCFNRRFFLPWISMAEIRRLVIAADIVSLSGHWTMLNALVYLACRRMRKPYLFCPAGALKPFGRSLMIKRIYNSVMGCSIVADAARCVAITKDEYQDFIAQDVPQERIEVIPNGIDPDLYVLDKPEQEIQAFRKAKHLGSAPYLLFLGRLNEIKGPDLLLEAFATVSSQYPDLVLVFAGPDGGMQATLSARTTALGMSNRVRFVGFVAGVEKAAALSGACLLVIPSRREAMSIVVLEAGICGCPVLFTDACGLADLVEAGAGNQVAVSITDIASALGFLLSNPSELKASGQYLAKVVAKNYLWSGQAQRFSELCSTVIRECRS